MRLVTHSGSFHADEVFAYAVLRTLFPKAELVRTRDMSQVKDNDIVFDVGGGKYDHHMSIEDGKPIRENGFAYSSAGLIWCDFGRVYIRCIVPTATVSQVNSIWEYLDESIFLNLDKHDNGEAEQTSPLSVTNVVNVMNYSGKSELESFLEATNIAEHFLKNSVLKSYSNMEDEEYVLERAGRSTNQDILVLDLNVSYAYTINKHNLPHKFVVYPEKNQWRVRAITDNGETFQNRALLPKAWRGKDAKELREKTGLSITFVHPVGFTGGAETFRDAYKMAELGLKEDSPESR